MPHCTSSKIRQAPTASQRCRSALRNGAPRSIAPARPCTGSTITAAVRSVTCAAITSAAAPRGMKLTSKGVRGKPYHFSRAPKVTAPAAAVRPWKAPSIAATCARPVVRSAILSAFSFASAPLFTRNTLGSGSCAKLTRRAAARSRTAIATALLWNWQLCAWRVSAAVNPGWS